jgi:hypothetical protein
MIGRITARFSFSEWTVGRYSSILSAQTIIDAAAGPGRWPSMVER